MNRGEGAFGEFPHGFSLPGYTAFPMFFEGRQAVRRGIPFRDERTA